jgi:hypothetical protein
MKVQEIIEVTRFTQQGKCIRRELQFDVIPGNPESFRESGILLLRKDSGQVYLPSAAPKATRAGMTKKLCMHS